METWSDKRTSPSPLIGQTLGHYRILEKIGAGGMGEVYRARDERLERDVAIKVLPAGALRDEASRRRFRKEALALAQLNHPNIGAIYDFDTQEGVDFLVLEYVSGVTLAEKIAEGPVPQKEVVALGSQLAGALEEAHEQGVVHRDLKPRNIQLTPKGQVKVLDFGIAKLFRPLSETSPTEIHTETQAVAGTLPYMAPEQLRGESTDRRTDVWGAGTVLYELATGRRPFEAKLATALAADIQTKPPSRPSQLNPQISSRLEEIILKCLEKDPEHRYQSAKELVVDLGRLSAPVAAARPPTPLWKRRARPLALSTAAGAVLLVTVVGLNAAGLRERLLGHARSPQIQSLAVLPLKNLTSDPEQEYFVQGMHEALTTELSKISGLRVISRSSAMRYKERDKSLPEIARQLNVDALVEGSVLRAGERVRVTAQLIAAQPERHLWADAYDRELRDILLLTSEVARTIADKIKVKLTSAEQARLALARPVNPAAYEFYLKGRYHWNKRTPEGFQKAAEHFQQAIELDPSFALAYAGLADNWLVQPSWDILSPREAYPRAKAAAERALGIDASLAEPYAALGGIRWMYQWDWEGAEQGYRRALELNPNYATAHHWYAWSLATSGRHNESIAEMKRAQELDPLSLIITVDLGRMYYLARHYDEAKEAIRKALEMEPNFAAAHIVLGLVHLATGRAQEAVAAFRDQGDLRDHLAQAYALAGNREEARRLLEQLEKESKERYVPATSMAVIYGRLGEKDRAFEWLEKSLEQRAWMAAQMKVEPRFDPLRDDPRFHDLMRRIGLPP
jgi:serine/threonine-protein kinase